MTGTFVSHPKPRCQPDRDKAPIPSGPPRRHSLYHQEGMHVETNTVLHLRRGGVSRLRRHVSLRNRIRRRLRRAEAARRPAADDVACRARHRLPAADHFCRAAQRHGTPLVQGAMGANHPVDDRTLDVCAVRQPCPAPAVLAVASHRRADLVRGERHRATRALDAVRRRLGDGADRDVSHQPFRSVRRASGMAAVDRTALHEGVLPHSHCPTGSSGIPSTSGSCSRSG